MKNYLRHYIIVRNYNEWISIQEYFFDKGIPWCTTGFGLFHIQPYIFLEYPRIITIGVADEFKDSQYSMINYGARDMGGLEEKSPLESRVLLRKYKLEKLKEL